MGWDWHSGRRRQRTPAMGSFERCNSVLIERRSVTILFQLKLHSAPTNPEL